MWIPLVILVKVVAGLTLTGCMVTPVFMSGSGSNATMAPGLRTEGDKAI